MDIWIVSSFELLEVKVFVSICVPVFVGTWCFFFLPWSGIARSGGKCMLNFMRNCQTCFPSTSLHSHQSFSTLESLTFLFLALLIEL